MSLQSWIFAWGTVIAALLSRRGVGPRPGATTGAQPPDRDLARDARAFMLGIRHHWIIYHNHKETMAHTAATLYLGAAAAMGMSRSMLKFAGGSGDMTTLTRS